MSGISALLAGPETLIFLVTLLAITVAFILRILREKD